jgi:serine/threonine protein phosphatase 1
MQARTLVIGDVHGGLKALIQVLDRCAYNIKKDNLIFVGDYVDGWPESAGVIDYIIKLKEQIKALKRNPDAIICIEGNHDGWLREFLTMGVAQVEWLQNGGRTTLESYTTFLADNDNDPRSLDAHRAFLTALHPYYVTNKDQAFVHAGCHRENGVGGTIPYLRVWDRNMWKQVLSGAKVNAHKEVFIGHTTTMANICKAHYPEADVIKPGDRIHVPMNRQNVWNVDTGGGWGGKLTIMDINTKEYWQSDFVKDLYPEAKGR